MYVFASILAVAADNMLTSIKFIQRQRVLALWRDIVRSTANIHDESTRKDMRQFARSEFEQHKQVTDLVRTYQPSFICEARF